MNHCRLAHDLLRQTAVAHRADIVIVSDPLYNLLNPSGGPTFVGRGLASREDVVACSARLYARLTDSRVLEDYTGTDPRLPKTLL